ncbi:BICD family-like cargo adapter 1 isoform X2 [Acanthaster planci]|uniref:BICD family-like cargo adapter 1 isoform X2 n=1 Tax=Acanthaster planci TaxID=133434 RepID=A0A8B7Y0L4_ACAPL|nr:BICD family-like cargo adapter 1 isoform X2 [Acanthaster planci]
MQNYTMACMSDHGSVVDNLSFDDYDPSQGSMDFFGDFMGVDKMDEAGSPQQEDLCAQLEQKEKDLILAAELGKALLERNEELTRRQEQMQQELVDKMEEVEQEKYHLRRQLEVVSGEYESKLLDLQTEIASLHKELANQRAAQKTMESQKQSALNELSEQNQRLVHQLKKAADVEDELNEHIQRLRDQVHLRRQHSQRENTHATEDLQKEVQRLSAKRGELERRLHMATSDRDSLASNLKETSDRCAMLDKQNRDLQQQLELRDTELAKLRQVHNDTAEELEELRYQATLNASTQERNDFQGNSLLSELGLELTGGGHGARPEATDNGEDEEQEDDIECDVVDGQFYQEEVTGTEGTEPQTEEGGHLCSARGDGTDSGNLAGSCTCNLDSQTLQDVLNEVHSTLSKLVHELKAFQVTNSPIGSPHHSPKRAANEMTRKRAQPDEVRTLLRDLTSVTDVITRRRDSCSQGISSSANDSQIEALESHIEALRGELSSTQAHIELLQSEIDRQENDLKKKDTEICTVSARVRNLEHELELAWAPAAGFTASCDETDLSSLSSEDDKLEERGNLSLPVPQRKPSVHSLDLSSNVSQEEVIDRLQSERDEAILRQTAAEQALFQAKADMNKLDDQLIGAIKQKVSLSEQLDQWQNDIHQLLDQRLKKQLTRQEVKKPDTKKRKASPQKRFPFWS